MTPSAHLAVPYRLVLDGAISMLIVAQDAGRFWPARPAPPAPPFVIIGDDLHASRGPCAFHRKSLRRLLGKAASVVIVAAEAHPHVYAHAAAAASVFGRPSVLIECLPETQDAWLDAVRRWGRVKPLVVYVKGTSPPQGVYLGALPDVLRPTVH